MNKLSEKDIENISKLYLEGANYNDLSKLFNICTWSISNALKKSNIQPRIRKYLLNENYFESIDTKEKSYWLGLLFADGYVRIRRQFNGKHKQGGIVGISLKDGDHYLLEQLIIDVESNYKLTEQRKDSFLSYKLEINSVKMTNDLISHGCIPKKSLILKPPNIKNYINHFIRGYIDGDGSIGYYTNRKQKRFKLSILGTEEFLEWIKIYFLSNDIKTSPKISKKRNIHCIQYNDQEDILKIRNLLYQDDDLHFLKRKKEIFFNK